MNISLHTLVGYLMSNTTQIGALLVLGLEWLLPRLNSVKANSTIELVANILKPAVDQLASKPLPEGPNV